ncbi:MAG: phosphatidate cytidylyltransferase [Pseudomonadota bacterium]
MAASPNKFGDLKARIGTATILSGVALGAIWAGGIWTVILVTFGVAMMLVELAAITEARDGQMTVSGATIWALPAVSLPMTFLFLTVSQGLALMLLMVVLVAVIDLLAQRGRGMIVRMPASAYILLAGLAFLWLRHFPGWGLETAIWIALVVAASDVGAYFAGRLIGGPKLWPAISPGKTWAGTVGGVVLAFLVGGLFSWATTGTYFVQVCTVSSVAAMLAQAGDLAESALKRRFAVKDSGALLPGHGGLLDRCDGLMAATLVAAIVTYWRGQAVFVW